MKKIFLLILGVLVSYASLSQPLPADQAFQVTAQRLNAQSIVLEWTIHTGCFLYKKSIQYEPQDASSNAMIFPKPSQHVDAQGHTQLIYRDHLRLIIPLPNNTSEQTVMHVHYQGCSDAGFCYPPETKDFSIAHLAQAHQQTFTPKVLQDNRHIYIILLSFFGFGLLLAFTPCVLPMIPVLSGIIVGYGADITTRKAFLLSCSYVLSMSFTYGLIGAVIALMGKNLQVIMQSPAAIGVLSFIFVMLALSMLDCFTLRLPTRWQNKIAHITRAQSSGHYLGAAIMGCMSTLILSPCVTGPLIGALSYIAQRGQVALGMGALFSLGLGMGAPLLLMGASAGALLPKAGLWMNRVKALFGVIFFAMAIHLLTRIWPLFWIMNLWGILFVFCGLYLGALERASSHREKLSQGMGIISLMYGGFLLIGASLGHTNLMQPLAATPTPHASKKFSSHLTVHTLKEAKKALHDAHNQLVVLDFYADWCASCKQLQHTTLQDPRVQDALHKVTFITVDLSGSSARAQALLHHFHVVAPPALLFINADGQELEELRLYGHIHTNELLHALQALS